MRDCRSRRDRAYYHGGFIAASHSTRLMSLQKGRLVYLVKLDVPDDMLMAYILQ